MENNAEQNDLWDDAAQMLFKKHNPNTDISSPVGERIYNGFLKDMRYLQTIFDIEEKRPLYEPVIPEFEINGIKYKHGDEVMFTVLPGRPASRGIFRGPYINGRYHIQDIDNNWKMPAGKNHCFTLHPTDFKKKALLSQLQSKP